MHSLNKTGRHCIALAHEAMSRIISTAQQSCRQIHCSKLLSAACASLYVCYLSYCVTDYTERGFDPFLSYASADVEV